MAAKIYYELEEALRAPEKVKRLVLILESEREALPDFSLFPNLEELNINGKAEHITKFPPSVFTCTKLKLFTMCLTSVETIPKGLGALEDLTEVTLVENNLTELPSDITKLTKLTRLNCAFNRLERLPKNIGQLEQLEVLIANNNAITSLPAGLFRLEKLWKLEIQQNKLKKKPKKLLDLPSIKILRCDFNDMWVPPLPGQGG